MLIDEDEPTPVRTEAFTPWEQSADARLDRADLEIASRPIPPGVVIKGAHMNGAALCGDGEFATLEKTAGGSFFIDRRGVELLCVCFGIPVPRERRR